MSVFAVLNFPERAEKKKHSPPRWWVSPRRLEASLNTIHQSKNISRLGVFTTTTIIIITLISLGLTRSSPMHIGQRGSRGLSRSSSSSSWTTADALASPVEKKTEEEEEASKRKGGKSGPGVVG